MQDSLSPHWYAVYTKPRCEKKVSHLLTKKHIENYCPLNKVRRQWSDRKKNIEVPLFTSYVFVRLLPREHKIVRETDNVFNFVYWLGKPAIIKDEEIMTIKKYLWEHQSVELERIAVNVNDTIRIKEGPLVSMEGKVTDVTKRTVRVLLPSLGFALVVSVDKLYVEKVDTIEKDLLVVSN